VRPTLRHKVVPKGYNNYSYSYGYFSSNSGQVKYSNKDTIPRLMWFHKDQTLWEVFQHIVKQLSFSFQD
jgi:hypothetical protein